MQNEKEKAKKAWPFRYAERFSGTSVFCLLFLAMKKSKSPSRLERQSQTIEEIYNTNKIYFKGTR